MKSIQINKLKFKGLHGALHYINKIFLSDRHIFTIQNCNFINKKDNGKVTVWLEGLGPIQLDSINFKDFLRYRL